MFWLVVPVVAYLVPVVDVPTWCQWWMCLPGASGGCAYLVPVVPVATSLVPVCLDHSGRAMAYTGGTVAGADGGASARRVLSRLNQSCRVRLIDAITLIINYLGAPFGCAFTELFVG